ncbi:MAG: hypothetical protein FWD11_05195, partial [Micrococcales bacterium]|nr:hypothetical protein [Micrococcales bacterium]
PSDSPSAVVTSWPLACTASTVTYTPGDLSGTLTVPTTSVGDIDCTFTNARTSATLTLAKTWVDGSAGDGVMLSIDGATAAPGFVTSTATGVPGSATDLTVATTPILSGMQVLVAESIGGANVGTYTADLTCDADGLTYTAADLSGTFTVPANPVDVTCTFTNTRTSATLTVLKRWSEGADGDFVELSITSPTSPGPPPVSVAVTATVPNTGNGQSDEQVSAPIFSGAQVSISETATAANTGTYDATVDCTTGDTSGTFTVPADPVDVTCTFANTRVSSTLTLRTTWVDGATNDTALLSIDDATTGDRASTSVATGEAGTFQDTANEATARVLSGDQTRLSEVVGGIGSYDVDLVCTAPGLAYVAGDTVATYTVPATSTDVVCTYTNTRTSTTLTLRKTWVDGVAGDTAAMVTASAGPEVFNEGMSTSAGTAGTQVDTATATQTQVFSGQMVLLGDLVGADNEGVYSTELTCTVSDGLVYHEHGVEGLYVIPAVPQPVTCTFTNTRTSATLTVHKTWVDGVAGDIAAMTVIGTDAGTVGGAWSVAPGTAGAVTDTDTAITVPIYSGETVEVTEGGLTGNVGSYTSQLTCDADVVVGTGGQGGTLVIGADPGHIECGFTNTRTSATVVFQVQWVDGAANDEVTLWADGVAATAHVPPGGTGPAVDKVVTTVFGGEQITVAWSVAQGNVGAYAWSLECDQTGWTGSAGGGTFDVPDPPVPVICTLGLTGPTPELDVTKSVISALHEGPTWTVAYAVKVSNPTTVPIEYVLTDTLAYGTAMTVTSTDVEAPAGVVTNPAWNGTTSTILTPTAVVPPTSTHEFVVTVTVTVPADANRECGTGGGFANSARAVLAGSPVVDPPGWSAATCVGAAHQLGPDPGVPDEPGRPGLSTTGARIAVTAGAVALLLLAGTGMALVRRRRSRV